MKVNANKAVRELRHALDQTQTEFGAMLGVTRDAVVSWELGRNRLSKKFARRVALATGAEEKVLLRGRGPVTTLHPLKGRIPFTVETFEAHRKSYWGRTDEAAARHHHRNCADALELLLVAAARPSGGKAPSQLPTVVDEFVVWCREMAKAFKLERRIDEQLDQRKFKQPLTKTYGEWRRQAKEDPTVVQVWGFKDDPKKSDEESLCLEAEVAPTWQPGYQMRRPSAG